MYINPQTLEYPIEENSIRILHPELSIFDPFPPEPFKLVEYTTLPLHDPLTRGVRELTPVFDEANQKWHQNWEVYGLTPEEAEKRLQRKNKQIADFIVSDTQYKLDSFAKTRGYDSMLSACSYANSKVEKFRLEGQYCADARDATWSKMYEILAQVQAGTRPMPSSYMDVEPELPVLVWP
jgi:hypothetical protein